MATINKQLMLQGAGQSQKLQFFKGFCVSLIFDDLSFLSAFMIINLFLVDCHNRVKFGQDPSVILILSDFTVN